MPYLQSRKDIEPRLREFKYLGGNRVQVTYEWLVNDTLEQDYHCFVHGVHPDSANPQGIDFQQDHALPKPTGQWRQGDVIVDGPHDFSIPDKQDVYDLVVGLHRGQRVRLKGVQSGGDRILVARFKLQRQDGKITDITAEKITTDNQPKTDSKVDFTAHLNAAGTWIDFGKIATDGSVKIQRERERLIVFPYPRDKRFRVSLDLQALAPSANPQHVQVQALAAGTQQPLGAADFAWEKRPPGVDRRHARRRPLRSELEIEHRSQVISAGTRGHLLLLHLFDWPSDGEARYNTVVVSQRVVSLRKTSLLPAGDRIMYSRALPFLLLLLISPALGQTPDQKPAAQKPSMLGSFLDAGMPDEVLFAVRKPSIDGHWYANIAYYSTDQCRTTFPMNSGGKLCIYNVKTKQVRTIFEDPEGNVRDPQIHYDAQKLIFAYLPKGKRHYSLYEINIDGTGLKQLTGQGEDVSPGMEDYQTYSRPDGTISNPPTCRTAK